MHLLLWMKVMHCFICNSRGIGALREGCFHSIWPCSKTVQARFNEKNIVTHRKNVSQVIYTWNAMYLLSFFLLLTRIPLYFHIFSNCLWLYLLYDTCHSPPPLQFSLCAYIWLFDIMHMMFMLLCIYSVYMMRRMSQNKWTENWNQYKVWYNMSNCCLTRTTYFSIMKSCTCYMLCVYSLCLNRNTI